MKCAYCIIVVMFFYSNLFAKNDSLDSKKEKYLTAYDFVLSSDTIQKTIFLKSNKEKYKICPSNVIRDLDNIFFMEQIIQYEYNFIEDENNKDTFSTIGRNLIKYFNEKSFFPPYSENYFDCDTTSADFIVTFSNVINERKMFVQISPAENYIKSKNGLFITSSILILLYFKDEDIDKFYFSNITD